MTGPPYAIRPSLVLLFANDLNNCAYERLKFIRRYRERRRKIDDVADRPDKHAQLDKSRTHSIEIGDPIQLHDTYSAFYADVFYGFYVAALGQTASQPSRNTGNLLQTGLPLEQIERCVRGRTAQGVRHVCRPV